MDKIITRQKEKIIGVLLSIFYFMRLTLLDADVKYFDIGQIQPRDELYYNELAVKIYKYGIGKILDGTWSSTSVANARNFFFPNIITGISLKIFGNNFWGLKIPYVIMGFCVGILLYLCIKILLPDYKLAHLLVILAYILDFNIFMLSREAVTVIPCMLACIFTVYGALKFKNVKLKWLFLGAWPVISFCLVYMSLPFLIIATGVYFVADIVFDVEERWQKVLFYILGIGLGVCVAELVSVVFFQQHIINTIADTLVAHGRKINGLSVFESIRGFINTCEKYWRSNAFRYNYLILILGITSLEMLFYGIIIKKDKYSFILFIYIFMHWMQTIFLDNATHSKGTISFPIILLSIAYVMCMYYSELFGKKGILRNISLVILFCSMLGSLVIMHTTIPLDTIYIYVIRIIVIISVVCILISVVTFKKKTMYIPGIITGIFMVTLSINYVLLNPTYTDKSLMQDLGIETNNGMVINGVGFNLYNMCEAPANRYDHYKGMEYDMNTMFQSTVDACYKYDDLYLIGGMSTVEELEEYLSDTPYYFEVIKEYPRAFRVSIGGEDRNQILFKKYVREK